MQAIDFSLVMDVLVKSAEGLVYLHSLKPPVAHRDFRRDNVLVFSIQPLMLKVADFGLAHMHHTGSVGDASATATIIGPTGAWNFVFIGVFSGIVFAYIFD